MASNRSSSDRKDSDRFASLRAVADSGIGKPIKRPAECYTCHEAHAAVDTTFVQFYPTLLPVAKAKGTLSSAYLQDEKATAAAK